MKERAVLQGARVTLRPPVASDRDDRLEIGRVAEYIYMCGGDPSQIKPFTTRDADGWYRRIADEPHGWCVEAEGRCIGSARLHSVDMEHRRARYAVGLFDPAHWGKGYGTEATRLVLAHAFDCLGLHRVDLRVLEHNQRAIACYERCGFVHEGIERESALIAGRWHSDVFMSILEEEYRRVGKGWFVAADERSVQQESR